MMDLITFILEMEGVSDFMTAATMSETIMEEIVENSIAVSEASRSSTEYSDECSPTSGERLHYDGSPCASQTDKDVKTIKCAVSKAKESEAKQPSAPNFLPPCRVCSDKASGFHYGANTCEACKGFFRRSIVKIQQNKESYKCTGTGQGCILGPGKRNACAACRYARCLEIGMSIHAIKTGRYTYEKRTRDTYEVQNIKSPVPPSQMETYISEDDVDHIINSLKEVLLRHCPNAQNFFDQEANLNRQIKLYNEHKIRTEVFGTMSVIPKDVWDEFYKETGIDLDDRQNLMKEMACRMELGLSIMVDFVRAIPGFSDLSVSDQTELIKSSTFEFWFLMHHKSFNPDLKVISGCIQVHQDDISKLLEKDLVDQIFTFSRSLKALDLSMEEVLLIRGISVTFTASHFEFMFIGHCNCINPRLKVVSGLINAPIQDVFKLFVIDEDLTGEFSKYVLKMQGVQLDFEESLILRGIVVTSADRCQLEDPKAVEKIQWKLLNALRVLAHRKNYRPEQRLWRILDRLTALRTMTEISKELDKQKCSWPVMKDHPLVLDILQS